jgi:hypothetical protein
VLGFAGSHATFDCPHGIQEPSRRIVWSRRWLACPRWTKLRCSCRHLARSCTAPQTSSLEDAVSYHSQAGALRIREAALVLHAILLFTSLNFDTNVSRRSTKNTASMVTTSDFGPQSPGRFPPPSGVSRTPGITPPLLIRKLVVDPRSFRDPQGSPR